MQNGADVGGGPEATEEATPRVLEAMAAVMERLVARNDLLLSDEEEARLLPGTAALEPFRAARAPSIRIGRYLERIYKYTGCSPACFVVAFAYVDRLSHRHPAALVVSLNVHRVVLAGVLVATKVLDDVHYDNAFYARVGGVSNSELNRLELELLFLLDFGVTVSSKVFESYCTHLEKEMMARGVARKINQPVHDPESSEEAEEHLRRLSS